MEPRKKNEHLKAAESALAEAEGLLRTNRNWGAAERTSRATEAGAYAQIALARILMAILPENPKD